MSSFSHLARRAVGSFPNSPPTERERSIASGVLTDAEFGLWGAMDGRDQRHSLEVLARFDAACPEATRDERAAALLHDVGKTKSGLGWCMRIVATIVGPRGRRFADYHSHEWIGAAMLEGVSPRRTIELVSGWCSDHVADALRAADDL